LENRERFYFPDASQISAMVGDHSRHMKTHVSVRRRWISLIANPLNCWAPVPLSQINVSFLENLGQTSGEYLIDRQNLGWSAKRKIPDCLGFSRHMKTRLKVFICRENIRRSWILLFADHPRFCRHIGYSPEVCRETLFLFVIGGLEPGNLGDW